MNNQISIFDILEQPEGKVYKLGEHIEGYDQIGNEINFHDLKKYVGSKIGYKCTGNNFKVIKVTEYWEDCRRVYKKVKELPEEYKTWYGDFINCAAYDIYIPDVCRECFELYCYADLIRYADNERDKKGEYFVSEEYCLTGKQNFYNDKNRCSFYELKGVTYEV